MTERDTDEDGMKMGKREKEMTRMRLTVRQKDDGKKSNEDRMNTRT